MSQARGMLVGLGMAGAALAVGALAARRERRLDFQGAAVVIAGGSRGLGLELARVLAAKGARLMLLGRDFSKLGRAVEELEASGADVIARCCDVRDRTQVNEAIAHAVKRMGRIDMLVNNAGVIQVGPLAHMDDTDFEQAMDTHYRGPLRLIQAVLGPMKAQGGGRIVNIASIGGLVAVPHLVPYCTSKAALVGLSDGMRAELARDRIYVTTVCPGLMRTGSHYNAYFKGRHRKELALFALSLNLPLASIASRRAARRIARAAGHGDPFLTFTPYARLAKATNALMPNLLGRLMQHVGRLLPDADAAQGDQRHSGWESRSRLAPSWLTRAADRNVGPNNQLPLETGSKRLTQES